MPDFALCHLRDKHLEVFCAGWISHFPAACSEMNHGQFHEVAASWLE
jgi:hypothetical protein